MYNFLNIVFAGEVDSGKSTLLGRLLYDTDSVSIQAKEELKKVCDGLGRQVMEYAYLLDSFQEERAEEFTLDTTQAFVRAKGKEFLLIDVPGHKELLKNMLTGASCADAAVLVIDASRSVEEQTKRHLFILKFLGIEGVLVVVNKMDLAAYKEEAFLKIKSECDGLAKTVGIKANGIIPVSAREGENLLKGSPKMAWHRGPSLLEVLGAFKSEESAFSDLRFPVQDIYTAGKEPVVVGSIASGSVGASDILRAVPSGVELKVKAIRVLSGNRRSASAPEAVGLLFQRLPKEIKRGEILYKGAVPPVSSQIRAKIFCLKPFAEGDPGLILSCSTQEVPASLDSIVSRMDTSSLETRYGGECLAACDAAEVILRTGAPVVAEKYLSLPSLGRFILLKDAQPVAIGFAC
ncbi:MAG TPA: hypothetical protein DCL35_01035 [Candidatus Omnitrophica bacterium]|nr:hypothetical protein [Candidatus Omnitrophota bacterium]